MKPGGSMPHKMDSPKIPTPSRINPIPRTDTNFFLAWTAKIYFYLSKSYSNIINSMDYETRRLNAVSQGLSSEILSPAESIQFLILTPISFLHELQKSILILANHTQIWLWNPEAQCRIKRALQWSLSRDESIQFLVLTPNSFLRELQKSILILSNRTRIWLWNPEAQFCFKGALQ